MEASRSLSRRRFLAVGAGAAAAFTAAGLVPSDAWAHGGHRHGRRKPLIPKRRIGIQLFTVRDLLAAGPRGHARALAEIGYREVEVAGVPAGQTAASFRALLDQYGCARSATTTSPGRPSCRSSATRPVEELLDEAETLGQPYIGTAAIRSRPASSRASASRRPPTATAARGARQPVGRGGDGARAALLPAPPLLGVRAPTRRRARSLFQILARRDRRRPGLVRAGPLLDGLRRHRPARLDPALPGPLPAVPRQGRHPNPAGGYFNPGFTRSRRRLDRLPADLRRAQDPRRHHYIVERDDQPHPLQTAEIAYDYLLDLRAPKHRRRGGDCDCEDDHDGGRHESRRPAVR